MVYPNRFFQYLNRYVEGGWMIRERRSEERKLWRGYARTP
jgi:hypothetical protein